MNETRYDWLSDRWVIFAPNRDERPDQYRQSGSILANESIECPFCTGREHETPRPTLVLPENNFDATSLNRRSNSTKPVRHPWQVRVVPNKFPAIPHLDAFTESLERPISASSIFNESVDSIGGSTTRQVQTATAEHLFQRNTPRGAHEVIIESPNHVDSITALPVEHIAIVFEAYRHRLNHWRAQRDLKYAVIFKNYGADAGASLYHSHSQLISLDFVPRDIEKVTQRLVQHHRDYGSCYICQMVQEEEERQERIFYSSEHFVALCPFASRFPYSFSIIPRAHKSRYEEITEEERDDLAMVTKKTLGALESAHPSAAYNFVLQTSPFGGENEESHHWRLRVIPRLSKVAGFEWGSQCFINTVTPEQATKTLRSHFV
jgi:UDPglucose--hexose-1-phosphate uridylyltransferase